MPDYYQESYKAYHEATFSVDPSFFLGPFAKRVTDGALVLDVGCGSGRDLVWLQKQGCNVIGFERSSGLADLARQNAGCEVIEGDFETYDFSQLTVDAILMSGSFVHLPHARLAEAFRNVAQALKGQECTSRFAYVSLKEGDGTKTDRDGRTFYLWQDDDLRRIFDRQGFSIIDFTKTKSARGTGEVWLGYVLERNTGR